MTVEPSSGSDSSPEPSTAAPTPPAFPAPPGQEGYPPPPAPAPYNAYQPVPANAGQLGKIRGTGVCILLSIVTLGIYTIYWYYATHEEMKRHSGQGLGGAIALILGLFVGVVMPYLTSSEVGGLYERRGEQRPVSALTGLWYFPGMLILVGPIVWFVKTNGALNSYWSSLGATR